MQSDIDNKIKLLEEQLKEANSLIFEVTQQVQDFKNSTSWRITAPLRKIKDFFANSIIKKSTKFNSQELEQTQVPRGDLNDSPAAEQTKNFIYRDRRELILKYADKSKLGIEVSPWHAPLAPKKEGYNIRTLDIFETSKLIEICKNDPNTFTKFGDIEEVDFVASATDIGKVIEDNDQSNSFDYILSSHNFEHLPNPIRFLQGCGVALKEGGILSMAIPDKRYTFDYFRPISTTGDFLESFMEQQTQPSKYQIFKFSSAFANNISADPNVPTTNSSLNNDISAAYNALKSYRDGREAYSDAHVHVFTPNSFEVIILELIHLNLIPFKLLEIISNGLEFVAHLENVGFNKNYITQDFDTRRLDLYRKIALE